MPITTDLSVPHYFDDYNELKNYYEVLFKPTVAVQTRELAEIQRIFQNQIEKLGNNLFKNGTIIDGVNFSFYDNYPYVKINDTQVDSEITIPSNYVGLFLKNANNLQAQVLNYSDGFEATDPDLKTLFVKYINSGNSFNDTAFSSGEVLTAYDANNSIYKVIINAGGSGYSNNDTIVFTPILLVNVNSGTLTVGDTIIDNVTSANGIVVALADETERVALVNQVGTVSVTTSTRNVTGNNTLFDSSFANGDYVAIYSNTTSYNLRKINVVSNSTFMNLTSNVSFVNSTATYANTTDSRVYVTYAPLSLTLANTSANSSAWSFTSNSNIVNSSNTALAEVIEVIGGNAGAAIITDSAGRITEIDMTNRGSGYTQSPYVSIKSFAGASANLEAQNYHSQITVSSLASPTGTGYAFGVSEGHIFQKGYIIRVDSQIAIIDKYSNVPDGVSVGFNTKEEIINSNIDTDLLDNASGYPNEDAPGADRLKLTAVLTVANSDSSSSNVEFFDLVTWSNGYPYKQNSRTEYNIIGDENADRTYDSMGDFVVDRFLTTTTSPSDANNEANTYNVVVDPGTAYVEGYKVQTLYNFIKPVSKETSTKTANNAKISLNYENFIRVNNVGGFFEFDRANVVQFYDTTKGYLANNALVTSSNTAPVGTNIGGANIRNFVLEQGTPGTPSAIYRLYLFNIRMKSGKNFKDIKAVYANSTTNKGIADLVLEPDATLNANVATLHAKNDALLFYSGFDSILTSNNIDYIYRTTDDSQNIANTGIITISLTGSPNKVFPYSGTLTDAQKLELYVAPLANLYSQSNLSGTVATNSTSNVIVGTSTDFVGELRTGQYINIIGGSSNNTIKRITAISNSTSLTLDSNADFTAASANLKLAWPKNVPIPLAYNGNMSANVNGTNDTLNINIGETLNVASNTAVIVAYNVENQDPTPNTKTPKRGMLVKLELSNNAATTVGPWCLGVPDIFRLDKVYLANNSSVSSSDTDVTSEFYINHNQNSSYYDLGYLTKKPNSSIVLTDDDYLLVKFDCFTTSAGLYTVSSYVSSNLSSRTTEDSKALGDLSSTVNTLEIPEVFDSSGKYYDLISYIDFRPYADATANVTSNTSAITTNPVANLSFASTDRYFPLPDSIYRHDVEYFLPRVDSVVLDKSKNIVVLEGTAGSNTAVNIPNGTMRLNNLSIPAYPSVPARLSNNMVGILNTGVYSGNHFSSLRLLTKQIKALFTAQDFDADQPLRYTSEDIGALDRRLKNVEYYVAFSLLQKAIENKVIVSSVSPSINRFKYGFFVDDYTDISYTDVNSPEYYASVNDGYATPHLTSFNVVHTGNLTSQSYTSISLVSQSSATTPPVPVVVTPNTSSNSVSNTTPIVIPTNYTGTITIQPPTFKTQSFQIVSSTAPTQNNDAWYALHPPATSSSGSKIVCTAMNQSYGFGSFRNAIWLEHSATMAPEYEIGYHKLFLPLVNRVYYSNHKDDKISKFIKKIGERVARKRTVDLWKMKHGKMDLEGRIYRLILEPLCYIAGKFAK